MGLQAEIEKRKTFGIISHPDAGKTTLTEKLLLFGRSNSGGWSRQVKQNKEECYLRFYGNRAPERYFRRYLRHGI